MKLLFGFISCLAVVADGNRMKVKGPAPWASVAAESAIGNATTWATAQDSGTTTAGPTTAPEGCHPKCWWSCGSAECDEVCEPVCSPPKCQTACRPIVPDKCTQKCEPPQCAVVCPSKHCEGGDCPKCKTICGEPKCELHCHQECMNTCADPDCTWKCKPKDCAKPKCQLQCGAKGAGCLHFQNINAKPITPAGATVVSKGLASLDPTMFQKEGEGADAPPGVAPAPADAAVASSPQ